MAATNRAAFLLLSLLSVEAFAQEVPPAPPAAPTPPAAPEPPAQPEVKPTEPLTATPHPAVDVQLSTDPTTVVDENDDDDKEQEKKKKKHHGDIKYSPGHWMRLKLGHHTALRFRMMVEPMMRYTQAFFPTGPSSDASVNMIVRRARVGFQADLAHHVSARMEISAKNMHYEVHNMFGAWKPNKHLELQFGFIKAPGGLERDTYSFDQPFIERSVMTFLNYDHEVGFKAEGTNEQENIFWAAAVMRDPPALPGTDPEDAPQIPTGVEKDDITLAASKWNTSGRIGFTPGDAFEVSFNAGARYRPDEPDFGNIAVEPYDTTVLANRPYRGLMWRVNADAAISQPHWKATAEIGFRRDGKQLAYPDGTVQSEVTLDGHLQAEVFSAVLGVSPCGHYGPAVAAAPLLDGWEIVTRVQGMHVKPVDQPAATLIMGELGLHWQPDRQVRLQLDMALEKFGAYDNTLFNENKDATRVFAQLWAVFSL
ncbi:MAG TPA: porin [Kofleriaceae bacterium]|jgi:hypothetical protein